MSHWIGRIVRSIAVAGATALPTAGQAAAPSPRAEVQINLCAAPEQVVAALGLEPESEARYEVWYLESGDLALASQGVTLRLRLKRGGAELTLKATDQDCARVAPTLPGGHASKCEYDVRGGRSVGAVSISRSLDLRQASALIAVPGRLASVLSPAQIEFIRRLPSAWPLPAAPVSLGPVQVQPYRRSGEAFGVEVWLFPKGAPFLEISQKTTLAKAGELDAGLRGLLARHRVEVCADQASPAGRKLRNLSGRPGD